MGLKPRGYDCQATEDARLVDNSKPGPPQVCFVNNHESAGRAINNFFVRQGQTRRKLGTQSQWV